MIGSLKELASAILVCQRCELNKYGSKPVPGDGPSNAKLFIVGEAPNREAELEGRPFVGWTGRIITQWLDYIGLSREEVYMTNAVKCVLREKHGKIRTNGLGPFNLVDCQYWLKKELEIVNSKIIVTVGAAALNSLLNTSVGKFHEEGFCQKVKGRFYCALFHPSRHSVPLRDDDRKILDQVRSLLNSEM